MVLADIHISDAPFTVIFVAGGLVALTGRRRASGTALPAALGSVPTVRRPHDPSAGNEPLRYARRAAVL